MCSLEIQWGKSSGHAAAAAGVCMHFWSNPAGKWINLDCARAKFSPGQFGPLQWETERKRAGLVIPEVVGLPVCHPQSPPTPPPKPPLTAVPIICLSVALLLPRQRRDEGIYCRLDKKEQKSCETNKDSLYFRQTLSDDAKSFMTRYILYLRKVFFICELHNTFGCV